jgi:hypothetical protein
LHGAQGIIQHDHPKLMIEIEERHNEGAISRVFDQMVRLGYQSWILDGARLSPIRADKTLELQRTRSGDLNNFFFLPHGAG